MKQISKILLALIIFISLAATLCSCDVINGIIGEKTCTHMWGDWSVVSGEHCEDRVLQHSCMLCGEIENRYGDESDHFWSEYTTIEPTCVNEGYDKKVCELCGKTLIKNTTEPTNIHNWEIMFENAPTCTKPGQWFGQCTVCKEKRLETVGEPTGEHDYTKLVASDNFHTYYCRYCDKEKSREEHIYIDGSLICEICGHDSRPAYNITLWVSPIENTSQLLANQIDRFAALYGCRINYFIRSVTEADAGYQIAADPSCAPDIFCFTQQYTNRLSNAGALAAPSLDATNSILTANDAASILAASVNGSLKAYPMTSDSGYYMYYDPEVITNPDSLEQIIADCEAAGKKIRFAADNAWYMASFFIATGCESRWITDEIGQFIGVNDSFNSEEGLVAMKGLTKLTQSSAYDSNADVCSNDTAVWITGVGNHSYAVEYDLEATDLPSFTIDGVTYHMGSYSGHKLIGVKPQEDEARAKLLEELALYLTSYECQIERFNKFGFGSSNLQAQGEIEDVHFGIAALHKQSEFAIPQGNIYRKWWDIAKMLGIAAENANTEQDLKYALDQYDSEIKSLFAEKVEWSVIGEVAGSMWDVDFPMTETSENVYESEILQLNPGDEFLIRKNLSWEMYFGYHGIYGGNFKIENGGDYIIRITALSEYEINVEILPVE